jgi:hypothetical protein
MCELWWLFLSVIIQAYGITMNQLKVHTRYDSSGIVFRTRICHDAFFSGCYTFKHAVNLWIRTNFVKGSQGRVKQGLENGTGTADNETVTTPLLQLATNS